MSFIRKDRLKKRSFLMGASVSASNYVIGNF